MIISNKKTDIQFFYLFLGNNGSTIAIINPIKIIQNPIPKETPPSDEDPVT